MKKNNGRHLFTCLFVCFFFFFFFLFFFFLGGGATVRCSLTVVKSFKMHEYKQYCYSYKPSNYTKLLIQTKYGFVKTLEYNNTSVVWWREILLEKILGKYLALPFWCGFRRILYNFNALSPLKISSIRWFLAFLKYNFKVKDNLRIVCSVSVLCCH